MLDLQHSTLEDKPNDVLIREVNALLRAITRNLKRDEYTLSRPTPEVILFV